MSRYRPPLLWVCHVLKTVWFGLYLEGVQVPPDGSVKYTFRAGRIAGVSPGSDQPFGGRSQSRSRSFSTLGPSAIHTPPYSPSNCFPKNRILA